MLCQNCNKNVASIRYAEVVDGEVMNLQLCKQCMAKRREDEGTGFEMSKPASQFSKERRSPISPGLPTTEVCPGCQTTLQKMMDTGTVGCPKCYDAFPVQLESLLEGLHYAIPHRGKSGAETDDARAQIRSDLQAARALLKTALQLENYEEAATLRDRIQRLESDLKSAYSEVH